MVAIQFLLYIDESLGSIRRDGCKNNACVLAKSWGLLIRGSCQHLQRRLDLKSSRAWSHAGRRMALTSRSPASCYEYIELRGTREIQHFLMS